jgi:hypothetical protein
MTNQAAIITMFQLFFLPAYPQVKQHYNAQKRFTCPVHTDAYCYWSMGNAT